MRINKRSEYVATLQEIKRLKNEKYRLGLQWNAIQKERKEDKEEQEKLEQLKQEYTALLKKDKGEISEKQNELAPIYDVAKETRNGMLQKQREMERKVSEAQKKFEGTRQIKQDQIDNISKHIAEQKVEITQFKEQIDKAKAEIANFVDEGIQSEPPKSSIFPSLEIGAELIDLPKKLFQTPQDTHQQMPQIPQMQSNYSLFGNDIFDNSHYKSCLDQIDVLMQQAQMLSVDQDFDKQMK